MITVQKLGEGESYQGEADRSALGDTLAITAAQHPLPHTLTQAMTVHPTLPQPDTKHDTETNTTDQAYTSMVFAEIIWKKSQEACVCVGAQVCVCVPLLNASLNPSAALCMQ